MDSSRHPLSSRSIVSGETMAIFNTLKRLVMGNAGVENNVKQPIFVVGCGRSGTTLLFDILSSHPSLARTTGYPDGEDHEGWIRHGKCVMAGIGNIHHSSYGNGINGHEYCLHMTREDVTDDVVRAMHDYYWADVLEQDKTKRVINKCPHNSNKLDYMLGIFPDAKIIHIVRDCQPMVASWLAMMDEHPSLVVYWPKEEELPCLWLMPKPEDQVALARLARHEQFFPGGGSRLWIDYWCKTNMGIEHQMQERLSQLLVIRYEDLVAKPKQVLDRIIDFSELPAFAFATGHLQQNTAQKHTHRMTPELAEAIAQQSRPVRERFGYESGRASTALAARLYLP